MNPKIENKPQIPGWVLAQIVDWMDNSKYGYLQINTQAGKIININKHETVKPDAS